MVNCQNVDCHVNPRCISVSPQEPNANAEAMRRWNARMPDPRLSALWQAIDDAMAAGEGEGWKALERIESAAYLVRTGSL